jgi:4-carboxymuconolactone decarboxylase
MAQRFPKLTTETMTPAQREVAAEITAGPRGEVRGPFIALIHNPELAGRLQKLGEFLRWKGKLPPKLKELAVLVTARRWTCQHEWVMHSKLALEGGLAPRVLAAIKEGREPPGMSPEERAVYDFCREVHASGRAGDQSFGEIEKRFGLDGALELIALNGYYTLMAMVLNTAGLPLPGNVAPPLAEKGS